MTSRMAQVLPWLLSCWLIFLLVHAAPGKCNDGPTSILQVGTTKHAKNHLPDDMYHPWSGEPDEDSKAYPSILGVMSGTRSSLTGFTRPNAGGKREEVEVGVLVKEIFDIDFKSQTFAADVVITQIWTDKRAIKLLPQGVESQGFGYEHAKEKLWLPSVKITNAVQGMDTISSTITVLQDGTAYQVDRVRCSLNSHFKSLAFPFDNQHLKVRLASTTLMNSELALSFVDDGNITDAPATLFDSSGFYLDRVTKTVYVDTAGLLEKSRAELDIQVTRLHRMYFENLFVPALLIVSISWAGFFLPGGFGPAMMPRVTTNFISFLSLITFETKLESVVPEAQCVSWVDVYLETCMALVYSAVVFNICILYIHHHLKVDECGSQMDRELQCLLPCLTVVTMCLCFTMAWHGLSDEAHVFLLLWTTRIILVLGLGGYLVFSLNRVRAHLVK